MKILKRRHIDHIGTQIFTQAPESNNASRVLTLHIFNSSYFTTYDINVIDINWQLMARMRRMLKLTWLVQICLQLGRAKQPTKSVSAISLGMWNPYPRCRFKWRFVYRDSLHHGLPLASFTYQNIAPCTKLFVHSTLTRYWHPDFFWETRKESHWSLDYCMNPLLL